jgi:hypothetical protein
MLAELDLTFQSFQKAWPFYYKQTFVEFKIN